MCVHVYSVHSFWISAGNVLMLTEMTELQMHWKTIFFQQSWNLISNSVLRMESMAVYFLLFKGLFLASVSKCIQLFAITWVSTTLCPPCALVLAQMVLISHWCVIVVSDGCIARPGCSVGQSYCHNNTELCRAVCWTCLEYIILLVLEVHFLNTSQPLLLWLIKQTLYLLFFLLVISEGSRKDRPAVPLALIIWFHWNPRTM